VFNRFSKDAGVCRRQALAGTPSQGARHATSMTSLDRLVCRAYGAQALEETLGENSPLATSAPATPAIEAQPEDQRNALGRKVLQKTSVLPRRKHKRATGSRKCTKVASEPN